MMVLNFLCTLPYSVIMYINHSCDPCAKAINWVVDGEFRIGIFSTRDIQAGEEITIDYQFQKSE